jgi:cytochrome c-type biogenesis protein CcmH/NrfG
MSKFVTWKSVVSHLGVLALGLVLGYQAPGFIRSYQASKVTDEIQSQIEQDPNNADNWASLGVSRSRISNKSGAVAAYQRALEIDSSNVTAQVGMGNIYYEDRDFGTAEKWYSDALRAAQKHNNPSEISTAQQLLKFAQARKGGQRK